MSELAHQYADWVRNNASQAKKIEEGARMVSMFAPKGEQYADVLTELSYSVMGVVGLVNDTIIHGKTKNAGEQFDLPAMQPQVHVLRVILTFFAHCETLLEVAMGKWGSAEDRMRLVVRIEVIKAACRLALVTLFPGQCLVAGGRFESHVEEPVAAQVEGADAAPAPVPLPPQPITGEAQTWRGRRSGVALQVPPGMRIPPNQRVTQQQPQDAQSFVVASEVLHLLRPLVTVFAPKTRFWLMVTFGMDVLSLRLLQASKTSADEFRRRAMLLVFYLLRSPLYDVGLGNTVTWLRTFKDTPGGMAMITEMIAFQIEFYHKTHFYSAAS